MKYLLFLLLTSPSFAATTVQSQDIGGSSITWNATESFISHVVNSTGSSVEMGTPGTNALNTGDGAVWAKNNDGVTRSSGCVVVVQMSANTASATWGFTTTTSAGAILNGFTAGVLVEPSCVSGAWCRVAMRGTYRVLTDTNGIGAGSIVGFGNAACTVEGQSSVDLATFGTNIGGTSGVSANAMFWMFLTQ